MKKNAHPGIYKRNGSWYAHIHWTDRNGKADQKKQGGFKTKAEAIAFKLRYLDQINRRTRLGSSRMKLSQYLIEEWLPAKQTEVKRSTHESYRQIIDTHIVPHLGDTRLEDLSPRTVDRFLREVRTAGRSPDEALSFKTVRNIASILKHALDQAVTWELIAVNPAAASKVRGRTDTVINPWEPHQLRAFLEHAQDDPNSAVWRLAAMTGMRRGELLGLRWTDIDFDRGLVTIQNTRIRAGNAVIEDTPKTMRSRRTISIDQRTIDALRRHKAQQNERRLLLGTDWKNEQGHVTVEPDGRPTHPLTFSRRFAALAKRAGLPRIRLHDVRHSYVVAARRSGSDIKTVSERIGHADTSVTLRVYDHVFREDDQRAANATANSIDTATTSTRTQR